MGMGYSASYADVIPWKNLKKICPKACSSIDDMLRKYGLVLDDFVRFLAWEDEQLPGDLTQDGVCNLFDRLDREFQKATKVRGSCLKLFPIYHDVDTGDRYDQISGGFFHVDGLYEVSPAGRKIADKITRNFFVRFG